ncbi:hypothetical protein VIBNISO65_1460011 [Vibrio nigripulchritudo SO65]|nr:hypothetical protein VIBNIFTn2_280011 [Vibrio nigripulchritudo FTn2]CCN65870.1 hypothetical protein VIBNIPon4_470011 [Vibrio nigripulchritudo POn4]CCN68494.1 hypothetical protein VIBNISFn118_1040027 [Vibrio nigripulchritudo SFn118]CCN75878.1 hypothetical protein VIBNISO65_1460011 [Vibrio nigripulchritudo SO65]
MENTGVSGWCDDAYHRHQLGIGITVYQTATAIGGGQNNLRTKDAHEIRTRCD